MPVCIPNHMLAKVHPQEDTARHVTWTKTESGACAAGILDGVYLHVDSLDADCQQHVITLMQQVLQSRQATSAGLSTAAVVGVGRLLMHAPDACADLEQTERLIELLVQSQVQAQTAALGEYLAWAHLTWCLSCWMAVCIANTRRCCTAGTKHIVQDG